MSAEVFISATSDPRAEALAKRYIDLAAPRLGSRVIFVSDDFFAPAARMLEPQPAIFIPGKYDDHGKWMDGWESRRKRSPGHDFAIVKLGQAGRIRAFDLDTSFFTGNFPPEASVEGWYAAGEPIEGADWQEVLPRQRLAGDSHNVFEIADERLWSHLRLNIFPDGGIARFRVYGEIHKDWDAVAPEEVLDLAALVNGGQAVVWNDAHYGLPANMLAPGRGVNMGDGWETARRRLPGNDWAVIRLGHPGSVERVLLDTRHFKGNYPDRFSLRAARLEAAPAPEEIARASADWPLLLPERKLSADSEQAFEGLAPLGPVTHVRLDIFPDGGVSRLRLFGRKA